MKRTISKLLLYFLLAVTLICPITVHATSFDDNLSDVFTNETYSRAGVYTITKYAFATYGNNSIQIRVNLQCRDEIGNSSGSYILGISSMSIESFSGWYNVERNSITKGAITYSNNNQTASLPITYRASTGTGFRSYSANITVRL